ncbi:MAG: hypothetical protein AAGF73_03345 [Actinomycetota bacterium]
MRRKVGLLHVPKAAGSSLSDALRRSALDDGLRVAAPAMDHTLFGSFADFGSLPSSTRQTIESDPTRLADADVVLGHYSLASLRHGRSDNDIVCVLREPRARLLSLYAFWRSWTAEQHAAWGPYDASRRAVTEQLSGFLQHPALSAQVDNVAARFLLAGDSRVPTERMIDPADHDALGTAALHQLANLGHVDTVEAGDDGWRRISAWVGAELVVGNHNVTPPGPVIRTREFEDAAAVIEQSTAIDQRLWLAVTSAHAPQASADRLRALGAAAFDRQRVKVVE